MHLRTHVYIFQILYDMDGTLQKVHKSQHRSDLQTFLCTLISAPSVKIFLTDKNPKTYLKLFVYQESIISKLPTGCTGKIVLFTILPVFLAVTPSYGRK